MHLFMDFYINQRTNKPFTPHKPDEYLFIETAQHRRTAVLGGIGSGKSTLSIIKALERLKRGCNGVMVAQDFRHLGMSLWPTFRAWVSPEDLPEKQRHRLNVNWHPSGPFTLNIRGGSLWVGSMDNDWRGINSNFVFLDEPNLDKKDVFKILDAGLRTPGPNKEPCQMWFTAEELPVGWNFGTELNYVKMKSLTFNSVKWRRSGHDEILECKSLEDNLLLSRLEGALRLNRSIEILELKRETV